MDWNAVNAVVALLGLVGGLVGFARSIIAERNSRAAIADADDARSDAVAALTKSADAEERIARAVEFIAGEHLTGTEAHAASQDLSALVPKRSVEWSVEKRIIPNSYRIRNIGMVAAEHVTATAPGYPAGAGRVIAPGMALTIGPPDGRAEPPQNVVVNWTDPLSGTVHSETYPVARHVGTIDSGVDSGRAGSS
jgi:hypothetical protein